jgi:sortase (surface protein transpeptidase)
MSVTDTDQPTVVPGEGPPSVGVSGSRRERRLAQGTPAAAPKRRLPPLWSSGNDAATAETADEPEPAKVLSPTWSMVRSMLTGLAVLAIGFVALLTVGSQFQASRDQQVLYAEFREELANAVAPVAPVFEGQALIPGSPVAILEVPALGLSQVVVYGTTSGDLMLGPGVRRDTVLPGQAGTTVVMGRQAAFGGPFGGIGSLAEGAEITVTTGQGIATYEVEGVRREGDAQATTLPESGSRLILTSAEGTPFLPDAIVRVDAVLVSTSVDGTTTEPTAFPSAGRSVSSAALPDSEKPMGIDTSQVFALVLWAQLFLAVVIAFTWARERWGRWQAWAVGLPIMLAVGWVVSDQLALLLPNLI